MRAVVFDLDGTLTDTLDLVVKGLNAALVPYWGAPKDLSEMRALFGPSEDRLIEREAPGDQAARERFYAVYEAEHARMAHVFPGAREALEDLLARGARLGVVTNKGRRSTMITLRAFSMLHLFDAIVTGDDLPRPKPDPEGILRVLSALGALPEETLYVGDSPGDMRAARAAGVHAVGAGWQAGSVLGADILLQSPTEIPSLLMPAGGKLEEGDA